MIIFIKKNNNKDLPQLFETLKRHNVSFSVEKILDRQVIVLQNTFDTENLDLFDCVEDIKCDEEKYDLVKSTFFEKNFSVKVGNTVFGESSFNIIAGPCSVENEKQIIDIAIAVKNAGANLLRGGAFKPRTSPYSFQGLGKKGIKMLEKAKQETGLPLVSEIVSIKDLDDFNNIDLIQIGARDMQNFELLKEVGKTKKPVLLKRGLCATIDEWLYSAEYIMSEGNKNIILCERGIRTFSNNTRNTLDLSSIPVIKQITKLPIIVDPSHASGNSKYVKSLSLGATAVGADGIMVEVHNEPKEALCDGLQALNLDDFSKLVVGVKNILPFIR